MSLEAEAHSRIQYVEFDRCNLIGVHWEELMPDGAFAEPIKGFYGCRLKYNTFSEMNLKKSIVSLYFVRKMQSRK